MLFKNVFNNVFEQFRSTTYKLNISLIIHLLKFAIFKIKNVINLADYYNQKPIKSILTLAVVDNDLIFLYVADDFRFAWFFIFHTSILAKAYNRFFIITMITAFRNRFTSDDEHQKPFSSATVFHQQHQHQNQRQNSWIDSIVYILRFIFRQHSMPLDAITNFCCHSAAIYIFDFKSLQFQLLSSIDRFHSVWNDFRFWSHQLE